MNDLNKLLEQASAPEDVWALDRQALVAEGHKRVARRRWVNAIAGAAAVAVIATLAAAFLPPGRQEGREIADHPSAGDYVQVRIPVSEVERRCTIAMNMLLGSDATWVAGTRDRRAVSATETGEAIETREGFQIGVRPEGSRARSMVDPEMCAIPQEAMLGEIAFPSKAEMPQPEDHEGVAQWCSRSNGYDLRGWSILAAVQDSDGWLDAVAISDNGYVASCEIVDGGPASLDIESKRFRDEGGKPIVPDDDTGPADPDRYQVLYPTSAGRGQDGRVEVGAIDVIRGLPDEYRITVSLPDGTPLATVTTNSGGFAYSFVVDDLPGNELVFEVVDTDGEPVWEGQLSSPPRPGFQADLGEL
jgi:hypothetical protein